MPCLHRHGCPVGTGTALNGKHGVFEVKTSLKCLNFLDLLPAFNYLVETPAAGSKPPLI